MNRRIALFLIVAAVVVLASGCNRPMSTGPLPPPQGQATAVGMPTAVVATAAAAGATSAPGATLPPGAATSAPPAATSAPAPAATLEPAPAATSAPESAPTAAPSAAEAGAPTTYVVQPGDWVYNIARKFNVSPNSIIEANDLRPPYSLRIGQTLTIPGGTTPPPGGNVYIVQRGDTLYSIARRYGKSVAAIAEANHLVNLHFIFVGQRLVIP
jgi:LysM repeat protein